ISYVPTDRELGELGLTREMLEEEHLFKGRGCEQCYQLGYKGRHGIYELMMVSNSIKRQLLKSADALELQKVAAAAGMMSLRHNGAELASRGITSSAEVLRVTRAMDGF
ncbi:MAG: type II secretion system protein GspE, partial [Anaerolineae bacterium]